MGNICIDSCLKMKTNDMEIYKLKGIYRAKVVSVYDGDTITIILFNKCGFEKHKVRMYGYNSPELKPRLNIKNRKNVIDKAYKAKKFLENLLLNNIVDFESFGYDKYGRLLGNIYLTHFCNKINVNKMMIEMGHGVEYYGGKK